MEDALLYDRLQFAFTVIFHYLFPQLTMGLALIIVIFKWKFIRTKEEKFNTAAKFWGKIFAVNFVMGVVTGIPMEFQFGTNWSKFSELTGNVIGQTLAMEGMFAFFIESTFLGLFLFGEKFISPKLHFASALIVFFGTWLSGFFIIATHSWMQHPVGYEIINNKYTLTDIGALFSNSWLWPSFLHNQTGSVITASFVVAGVGAFYLLRNKHVEMGKLYVKTGVISGAISTVLVLFPFGDLLAAQVAKHQPVTLAAMEGLFDSQQAAPMALIGQPNMRDLKLDNPIEIPGVLSFLTYKRFDAEVKGLKQYDKDKWPTNVPGLYYAYHIMVGLGTMFIGLMLFAALKLYRKKLYTDKNIMWLLMLFMPLPYIANTAGWTTSEMGRQPWLVYDQLRTTEGLSLNVTAGNTLFTFLGFIGLYILLGLLFMLLVGKIINKGH